MEKDVIIETICMKRICMKCQTLFSNISKRCLLEFAYCVPFILSVELAFPLGSGMDRTAAPVTVVCSECFIMVIDTGPPLDKLVACGAVKVVFLNKLHIM